MKKIIPILLLISVLSTSKIFAEDNSIVAKLIETATLSELYNEREWHVLMLYKDPIFGKIRSLVDDDRYFLAPDGKVNPQSELNATIRAIFDNRSNYDNESDHPICKFPARSDFIVNALNIDIGILPKVECSALNTFIKDIDATSVTLVFPFLYIENPMSIFGHTLLRINGKRNEPLIGIGVTYSAETGDANMFAMFLKGFTGGFEGKFSIKRYYTTIFEYNNIDNRDIWEYDLNFTKEETLKIVKHLWEMQDIRIDYFFLDENCSYHLLLLLEAARPELRLTTSILWEAPSDSVRTVIDNNLVKDVKYRQSHIKELESIADTLPRKAVNIATDVGKGLTPISTITSSDYPDRIKATMLDYANEILKYNTISSSKTEESIELYKNLTIDILSARSEYRIKSDYNIYKPISPDKGHRPSMVGLSLGAIDNNIYTDLTLRLGFNSLSDIDDGFIPASNVTLFEGTVGYNYMEELFLFKEFTLANLQANIPLSRLSKKPSFKFEIAGKNRFFSNYNNYFTTYISGGVGVTFKLLDSTYFYILGDLEVAFGKPYTNNVGAGFGGVAGLISSFKYGKLFLNSNYKVYPFTQTVGQFASFGAGYTFPISQNNALTLNFERIYSWGRYKSDIYLKYSFFF